MNTRPENANNTARSNVRTNADMIRDMSEERLARWLSIITDSDKKVQFNGKFMNGNQAVWEEWLKSPHETYK